MFKKIVVISTIICFFLSGIAAEAIAAVLNTQRGLVPINRVLDSYAIPSSVGRITSAGYAGSDRVVIAIQDLHCHPEVQRNTARLLSLLRERYPFSTIYVEGASGELGTGWIRGIQDHRYRDILLDSLVARGRLTGEEYYAGTVDTPIELFGLENASAHRENIVRMGTILKRQDEYAVTIARMRRALARAETQYFSSANRRFSSQVNRYRDGKITSQRYYRLLLKYARAIQNNPSRFGTILAVSPARYQQISAYLQCVTMGEDIDQKRVGAALQDTLRQLRNKVPYSAYCRIQEKTSQFADLHTLCEILSSLTKDPQSGLPSLPKELSTYLDYVEQTRTLNPVEMLAEERRLVDAIRIGLASNVAELDIAFLDDFITYYDDFLRNSLQEEGYAYVVNKYREFRAVWNRYIPDEQLVEDTADYALLDKYYQVNTERNRYFVENMLRHAGQGQEGNEWDDTAPAEQRVLDSLRRGAQPLVVVTGGFHTPGLVRLLKERKISYLCVTPQVTTGTETATAVYRQLARQQARVFTNALRLSPLSAAYTPDQVEAFIGALEPVFEKNFTEQNIRVVMDKFCSVWNSNELVQKERETAGEIEWQYNGIINDAHHLAVRFKKSERELRFTVRPGELQNGDERISLVVKDPQTTQEQQSSVAENIEQANVAEQPAAQKQPQAQPPVPSERSVTDHAKSSLPVNDLHALKQQITQDGRRLREQVLKRERSSHRLVQMVGVMESLLEVDEKDDAGNKIDKITKIKKDPAYRRFMAGEIGFQEFLDAHPNIRENENLLKYATDQSPYPWQFIVEMLVNGQDATIRVNGESKPVGQFGVGAYQMFRELIDNPSALITMESCADAERSVFIFWIEDNQLMCAFERTASPEEAHGTRIAIDTDIENPRAGKEYARAALKANAQGIILDENGMELNNPEQYAWGNSPGTTLRNPSEEERPPVRFGIWHDGILVADSGVGMAFESLIGRFLVPKQTDKQVEPDLTSDADHLYRFDPQEQNESDIAFYIKGEAPVHCLKSYRVDAAEGRFNLCAESVFAVPRGTRISEDRSVLYVGEEYPAALYGLRKLIDKLTDPRFEMPDHTRAAQINTLVEALQRLQGIGKVSSEADLLAYLKGKASAPEGIITHYRNKGCVVLPNKKPWQAIAPLGKHMVYLHESLYQLENLLPSDVFTEVSADSVFEHLRMSVPSVRIFTVANAGVPVAVETSGDHVVVCIDQETYERERQDPEVLLARIVTELPAGEQAIVRTVAEHTDTLYKDMVLQRAGMCIAREETHMDEKIMAAIEQGDTEGFETLRQTLGMRNDRKDFLGRKRLLTDELAHRDPRYPEDIQRILGKYGYADAVAAYYQTYSREHRLHERAAQDITTALLHQGYDTNRAAELLDGETDWTIIDGAFDRTNFAGYTTSLYGEGLSRYTIKRLVDAIKAGVREGQRKQGLAKVFGIATGVFCMLGVELLHNFVLRYFGSVYAYRYGGRNQGVYLSSAAMIALVRDQIVSQDHPLVTVTIPVINRTVHLLDTTGKSDGYHQRAQKMYRTGQRVYTAVFSALDQAFILALGRYLHNRAVLYFWSRIVAGSILTVFLGSPVLIAFVGLIYEIKLLSLSGLMEEQLTTGSGGPARWWQKKNIILAVGTLLWVMPLAASMMGVPLAGINLQGILSWIAPPMETVLSGTSIARSLMMSFSVIAVAQALLTAFVMKFYQFKKTNMHALMDQELLADKLMLQSHGDKNIRGYYQHGTNTFIPWSFDAAHMTAYAEDCLVRTQDSPAITKNLGYQAATLRACLGDDHTPGVVRGSAIQRYQLRKLLSNLMAQAPPLTDAESAEIAGLTQQLPSLAASFTARAEALTLTTTHFWQTVIGVAFNIWFVTTEIVLYLAQLRFLDHIISIVAGSEIHFLQLLGMFFEGASEENPVPLTGWRLYTPDSLLGHFVIDRGGMLGLFESIVSDITGRFPVLQLIVSPHEVITRALMPDSSLVTALQSVADEKRAARQAGSESIRKAARGDEAGNSIRGVNNSSQVYLDPREELKAKLREKIATKLRDRLNATPEQTLNVTLDSPPPTPPSFDILSMLLGTESGREAWKNINSNMLREVLPDVGNIRNPIQVQVRGPSADTASMKDMMANLTPEMLDVQYNISTIDSSYQMSHGGTLDYFSLNPIPLMYPRGVDAGIRIPEGRVEGDVSYPLVYGLYEMYGVTPKYLESVRVYANDTQAMAEYYHSGEYNLYQNTNNTKIGTEKIITEVLCKDNYAFQLYFPLNGVVDKTSIKVIDEKGQNISFTPYGQNGVWSIWVDGAYSGEATIEYTIDLYERIPEIPYTPGDYRVEMDNIPAAWDEQLLTVKNESDMVKLECIREIMSQNFVYNYTAAEPLFKYMENSSDPHAGNTVYGPHAGWMFAAQSFVSQGQRVPVVEETATVYYMILARRAGLQALCAGIKNIENNQLYANRANSAQPVVKVGPEWGIEDLSKIIPVAKPSPKWIRPQIKPPELTTLIMLLTFVIPVLFIGFKTFLFGISKVYGRIEHFLQHSMYRIVWRFGYRSFKRYVRPVSEAGVNQVYSQYKPLTYITWISASRKLFNRIRSKETVAHQKPFTFSATLSWGKVVFGRNFPSPELWKGITYEFDHRKEGSLYVERNDGTWQVDPLLRKDFRGLVRNKMSYVSHQVVNDTVYLTTEVLYFHGLFKRTVITNIDKDGITEAYNRLALGYESTRFVPLRSESGIGYVVNNRSDYSTKLLGTSLGTWMSTVSFAIGISGMFVVLMEQNITSIIFATPLFIISLISILLRVLVDMKGNYTSITHLEAGGYRNVFFRKMLFTRSAIDQPSGKPFFYMLEQGIFRKPQISIYALDQDGVPVLIMSQRIVRPRRFYTLDDCTCIVQKGEPYIFLQWESFPAQRFTEILDKNGKSIKTLKSHARWDRFNRRVETTDISDKFSLNWRREYKILPPFDPLDYDGHLLEVIQSLDDYSVDDFNQITQLRRIGNSYYAELEQGELRLLYGNDLVPAGDLFIGQTQTGGILRLHDGVVQGVALDGSVLDTPAVAVDTLTKKLVSTLKIFPSKLVQYEDHTYQLFIMSSDNKQTSLVLFTEQRGSYSINDRLNISNGQPLSLEIAKTTGLAASLFSSWDSVLAKYLDEKDNQISNVKGMAPFSNGNSPFIYQTIDKKDRVLNNVRMQLDAPYIHQCDETTKAVIGMLPGRLKHWSIAYAFMPEMTSVCISQQAADTLSSFVRVYLDQEQGSSSGDLRELLKPVSAIYRLFSDDPDAADLIVGRYLEAQAQDGFGKGGFAESLRTNLLREWKIPGQDFRVSGIDLLNEHNVHYRSAVPSLLQFYLRYLLEGSEQLLQEEDESSMPDDLRGILEGSAGDSLAKLLRVTKKLDLEESSLEEIAAAYAQENKVIISDAIKGAITGQEGVLPVWLRELAQNARDAMKKFATRKIEVRSFINRNRWIVTVKDTAGMTFETFLTKLLVPDATTKSYEAEIIAVMAAADKSTDSSEALADAILRECFNETLDDPASVRTTLMEILMKYKHDRNAAAIAIAWQFRGAHVLKKLNAGSKGQGFFTVFNDADEVRIRTGKEKKVYEITLRPIRARGEVVDLAFIDLKEYADPNDYYQGTEISMIRNITGDIGAVQMQNNILYFYAVKMIGAIRDCAITWNGKNMLDDMEQVTPHFRRSKTGIERLNVDELFIQDPTRDLMFVPHEIAQQIMRLGPNFDFSPAEVEVVRTRNAVQDPAMFKRTMARVTLAAAACLWREGVMQLPGLPSYDEYMNTPPWCDPEMAGTMPADAAIIDGCNGDDAFWEHYEKTYADNAIAWAQLMLHVLPLPGEKSLAAQKEEQYYAHVPAGLRAVFEMIHEHRALAKGLFAASVNGYGLQPYGSVYAHLKIYALLIASGRISSPEVADTPQITAESRRISEQVKEGNLSALAAVNDNNWRRVAAQLPLPELEQCTLDEFMRKDPADRSHLLRIAGLDDLAKSNEVVVSLFAVFSDFLTQVHRNDPLAAPEYYIELSDTRIVDMFIQFIEGKAGIVPLVDYFVEHMTIDQKNSFKRALYNEWLIRHTNAESVRKEILAAHTEESLRAAARELKNLPQKQGQLVVLIKADAGEEPRPFSVRHHAAAALAAAAITATSGLCAVVTLMFGWDMVSLASFVLAVVGSSGFVTYTASIRRAHRAAEEASGATYPRQKIDLTKMQLPEWIDKALLNDIAPMLRAAGLTSLEISSDLPADRLAETDGTMVHLAAWLVERNADPAITKLRRKLIHSVVQHEVLRIRLQRQGITGRLQDIAVYLAKVPLSMVDELRPAFSAIGSALSSMMNFRRFASDTSASLFTNDPAYQKANEHMTGTIPVFSRALLHLAETPAARAVALATAQRGYAAGLHNICLFIGTRDPGAVPVGSIIPEGAATAVPVYAGINGGICCFYVNVQTAQRAAIAPALVTALCGVDKFAGDPAFLQKVQALYAADAVFGSLDFTNLSFSPGMIVAYDDIPRPSVDQRANGRFVPVLDQVAWVRVVSPGMNKSSDTAYHAVVNADEAGTAVFDLYGQEIAWRTAEDSVTRGRAVIAEQDISEEILSHTKGTMTAEVLSRQYENAAGILLRSADGIYGDQTGILVRSLGKHHRKVYGWFPAGTKEDIQRIGEHVAGTVRINRNQCVFEGVLADMSHASANTLLEHAKQLRAVVPQSALLLVILPVDAPNEVRAYCRDHGMQVTANIAPKSSAAGIDCGRIGREVGDDPLAARAFIEQDVQRLPLNTIIINADEFVQQLPAGMRGNEFMAATLFRMLGRHVKTDRERQTDEWSTVYALRPEMIAALYDELPNVLRAVTALRSHATVADVRAGFDQTSTVALRLRKMNDDPARATACLEALAARILETHEPGMERFATGFKDPGLRILLGEVLVERALLVSNGSAHNSLQLPATGMRGNLTTAAAYAQALERYQYLKKQPNSAEWPDAIGELIMLLKMYAEPRKTGMIEEMDDIQTAAYRAMQQAA